MIETTIQIGSKYVFNYPDIFVTLPDYTAHAGCVVTVVRPLSEDEYDYEGNAMFVVEAEDGWSGHAFETELGVLVDD